MKSSTAPSFWRAYQSLPPEVRAQARKTYRLWQLLELLSRARLGRALAREHHWANSSSCRRRREESHYSATNRRSETPHVVSYNTWSHELALGYVLSVHDADEAKRMLDQLNASHFYDERNRADF